MEHNLILDVTLPIYYPHKKKPLLLGWNQVMNLHPYTKNNMKRWYDSIVLSQLSDKSYDLYDGKFIVEYDLYYPHARIDMSNVLGVTEKFFLDSIQNAGVVKSDNVNNHVGSTFRVAGRDGDKPRVEIRIYRAE
ncbi:MAG: hypothetical protein ACRCX7_11215 [Cetobacterium sp.]|uniref:hypothetical protein n=1 Tax=Cetobacterium sp. TaxID=2071632 RepID=UPI003F39A8E4